MDRHEEMVNELGRILKTVDGRDFIYQFFLTFCGVDFAAGIPNSKADDYTNGVRKPALDIMNLMIYNWHDSFKTMLLEQSLRAKNKGEQ